MLIVSGFSQCYLEVLPMGKKIGIFTVSLVWKILREITTAITTGAPGKVKNLGEFY